MEPLLGFLGASRDAGGFVRSYLTVVAFAGPVSSVATTFANVLHAAAPQPPIASPCASPQMAWGYGDGGSDWAEGGPFRADSGGNPRFPLDPGAEGA